MIICSEGALAEVRRNRPFFLAFTADEIGFGGLSLPSSVKGSDGGNLIVEAFAAIFSLVKDDDNGMTTYAELFELAELLSGLPGTVGAEIEPDVEEISGATFMLFTIALLAVAAMVGGPWLIRLVFEAELERERGGG